MKGIFAILFALIGSSVLAVDMENGKAKSAVCAACHGADGNSQLANYPKIAGQEQSYILKQLLDIKSKKREVLEMEVFLTNLTDSDLEDVAAFYSKQATPLGATEPEYVDLGEQLYKYGKPKDGMPACFACHGLSGDGISGAPYPHLTGQHPEYTVKQLTDFRELKRTNDGDSATMREVAVKLSDREIKALSQYIYGLRK